MTSVYNDKHKDLVCEATNHIRDAATFILPNIETYHTVNDIVTVTDISIQLLKMSKSVANIAMQMPVHQCNIIANIRDYTAKLNVHPPFLGQLYVHNELILAARTLEKWYPLYWHGE